MEDLISIPPCYIVRYLINIGRGREMNKETIELGMVVHTCNLSIQEAEAGGS
jgi:hypothetical protein